MYRYADESLNPKLFAVRSVAVAAALIAFLCSCEPRPSVPLAETDSEVAQWTLVRELTIGSVDDPASSLSATESIAVDNDGRIFVAQKLDRQVRVFSPEGVPLYNIGRAGEGPGEFQLVGDVGWLADTLWVTESRIPKVSLFTKDGEFIRSQLIVKELLEQQFIPYTLVGYFADGTLLMRTSTEGGRVLDGGVSSFPLVRVDSEGAVLNQVGEVALGNTLQRFPVAGGREVVFPHPMPNRHLLAICPQTNHLFVLDRIPGAESQNSVMQLHKISSNGDTLFTRELPYGQPVIQPDYADSVRLAMAQRLVRAGVARSAEAVLPAVERSLDFSGAPLALHLMCTSGGDIWIRLNRPGMPEAHWEVFSGDGQHLASVRAPTSPIFHEASRSNAWAVELDSFDVPYVVRYRVVRE